MYSEVSNKHGVVLILFEKIFPTKYMPPRLFDFGKFSYLHVIRTPRLLETLEYLHFQKTFI